MRGHELCCPKADGPSLAICAGKNSIADYLTRGHEFSRLHLLDGVSVTESSSVNVVSSNSTKDRTFNTIEALLDHVTKQWRQRWVTTDIWNEAILEVLMRRPSFILVSVDAPLNLRWTRFRIRQGCCTRSLVT